ncbi:MAG TPA: phosphoribosylamine--glycine ligase [Blastocatellia bacterium]|nr:phosphoribosylamine--glycine ligase [Blastocatellia bacterium]
MKILVIGSGGREHAICWKIAQSGRATDLYCAPGNAGITEIANCFPADVGDAGSLANLAESIGAELTVIGPEAPLVAGVADVFETRGLRLVGPSQAAAKLEGSKIFAKQFMARHSIPTARFTACHSAESAIETRKLQYPFPVVIKADGLAAGKGVLIANDEESFAAAVTAMMETRLFGEAGTRVVLEECLTGREASVMVFTDGRDYRTIAPAQDYKRVFDNDEGYNTGGMGSFSTPDLLDEQTMTRVTREIIEPTLEGMRAESTPFRGVLYFGLMLTGEGPKVIEYNARFGDPETQAIMMRLESDLVGILESIVDGSIGSAAIEWSRDSSVCVVAASGGYPGECETGKPISGLAEAREIGGVEIFHASTMRDEQGSFLTAGGRVLGVTARGSSLEQARALAYEALGRIHFENMHYRKDIAATGE